MYRTRVSTSLLIVCLVASLARAGAASDFTMPDVSQVALSTGELKAQVQDDFAYDPVLSVNPNRGAFATAINVPLPPNLPGLEGIRLSYNSQLAGNFGLGVGWRWNLPTIWLNPKPTKRAPFLTQGLLGSYELARTRETGARLRGLVARHFQAASLEVYRPVVDEDFTAFIRALGADGAALGWVAAQTNGNHWVFDAHGLPVQFVDRRGNSVQLTWSDGRLASLAENRGMHQAWTMTLAYTAKTQDLPVSTLQGWFKLPLGLDSVDYGNRKLRFAYDGDGFLLAAGWEGGVRPLFQGRYSAPERPHTTVDNTFAKDDDLVPYRLDRAGPLAGYKVENDPDYIDYLVDLNSDGRTDLVRFDRRTDKSNFKFLSTFCNDQRNGGDLDGFDRNKAKMNSEIPITVSMAVQHGDGGATAWEEDRSLAIGFDLRPYVNTIDMHVNNGFLFRDDRPECKSFRAIPRAMFFVDLNGDGRKDVVDCGYDSDTTATTWDTQTTPFKRSHSNVVLGALNYAQPGLVAGHPFSNPFQFEGQPAKVWLGAVDEDQAEDWLKQTQGRIDPTVSFLKETSQWLGQPQQGFKCHRGSLFFDANHDGKLDVLTGHTLYLAGPTPGEYHAETVDPAQFFEAGDPTPDMTDSNLNVYDTDGNGKFEVRQARALTTQPGTGLLELVHNKNTEVFAPAPAAQKLLTKMQSPYGGEIDLSYKFTQGEWVLDQIVRDPKSLQPRVTVAYDYGGTMVDPYRGAFVGFSETRSQTTVDDAHETPRVSERLYYKDLDPAGTIFSSRARLNGRLMLERELDPRLSSSASQVLHETTHDPSAIALGDHRIYVYDRTDVENIFGAGTTRILDQKTTTRLLPTADSGWALSEAGDRILPVATTVEERGPGLRSLHSDQLTSTLLKTVRTYSYFPEVNVQALSGRRLVGKNEQAERADLVNEYNGQTYDIVRSCEGTRCTSFGFDALGRLSERRSNLGAFKKVGYDGDSALPSRVTTIDGDESRIYDQLTGRLTDLTVPTGASYHRDYTIDGLLLRMTARENASAVPHTFLELYGGKPKACAIGQDTCVVATPVPVSYLDTQESWALDGFGRIEATVINTGFRSSRHTGLVRYGLGREVISRTRPQAAAIDSGVVQYEAWRDSLGRIVKETEGPSGGIGQVTHEITFDGPCKNEVINGGPHSSRCTNLFGHLESQSLGNEELDFETNGLGDLLALGSLGVGWELNDHSEVQASQARFDNANGAILKGAAEWARTERDIEETQFGMQFTDENGLARLFDPEGRLLTSQKLDDLGTADATDVRETRAYANGALTSRALSLKATESHAAFLSTDYSYNGYGDQIGVSGAGFRSHMTSDEFGRPVSREVTTAAGKTLFKLEYTYERGRLAAIRSVTPGIVFDSRTDLVRSFQRDVTDRITSVSYGNGLTLSREYVDLSPRLKTIEARFGAASLWSQTLTEDAKTLQIVGRDTTSSLRTAAASSTESFAYDPGSYHLTSDPRTLTSAQFERLDSGRVSTAGVSGSELKWNGDFLSEAQGRHIYYDGEGAWAASCPVGAAPDKAPERCVLRLDADTYLIEGQLVALIRAEKLPVALWQDGAFHPLVVDQLGSPRASLLADGSALEWERQYGAWGRKTVTLNPAAPKAAEHERAVLFSFGNLMEQPSRQQGDQLYWSRTRVYSSAAHEWLSVDPLVKWSPSRLIDSPGNWHAVRYAGNNPLSMIDPAGSCIWDGCALEGAAIFAGVQALALGVGYAGMKAGQEMNNASPAEIQQQDQEFANGAKLVATVTAAAAATIVTAGASAEVVGLAIEAATEEEKMKIATAVVGGAIKGALGEQAEDAEPNYKEAIAGKVAEVVAEKVAETAKDLAEHYSDHESGDHEFGGHADSGNNDGAKSSSSSSDGQGGLDFDKNSCDKSDSSSEGSHDSSTDKDTGGGGGLP